VHTFLIWVESTAFSVWVRESPSLLAFPGILCCHTIGMGIVAGINGAIGLRILGVGRGVPLAEMKRFLPIMWFGFWLNAASGVALLVAYPTKALTNPLFYVKLGLIAVALVLVRSIGGAIDRVDGAGDGVLPRRIRMLAAASLASWAGAITSGRLLAYTYSRLMS
jgi:hypothetical protein